MDFLLDILDKPFTQLRVEQQIVAVLAVLLCLLVALGSVFLAVRRMRGGRRHWRHRQTEPIEVFWADGQGFKRRGQGRCVEMSAGGLRMELQDPIPAGTSISFHLLQTERAGTAAVRHCTPAGSGYVIGVEFTESR